MRAAGGTFISARTLRTPETRSISQFISARASSCRGSVDKSGQGESISMERRGTACSAIRAHNSSVMNGMKGCSKLQDAVEHPGGGVAGFALFDFAIAVQHRLDEFDIPVAEHVPDEMIDRARRIVEAV